MNIQEWIESGKPWNVILHGDCMDLMKHFNDKEIQLCIVDPPYGIGEDGSRNKADRPTKKWKNPVSQIYKTFDDSQIPDKKYFDELFRISENQIIWGANNFSIYLPFSTGWIVWDKKVNEKELLSQCELAFSSFKIRCKKFEFLWAGFKKQIQEARIHPTQKPIALYRWLLQNYAKPGDKIIDTHSGSGSLACACHLEKFDFLAIEKDADYYKASCERLETLRSQGILF